MSVAYECAADTEGALLEAVTPSEDFEPDLSLEDITNGRLARIIEETRMRYLIQLDAKNAAGKLKRECIGSEVRNEMQRDGVMSHKIKGVGLFKLYPPKPVQPCESCMAQFGFGGGDLDPYLGVYPETKIA